MGLGEEQEPRPKAGKWRTRFLSSKGVFLETGDVAWKSEDRRLGAPCGALSLAQEEDPELQAVEAFWQEDDVIRCVSEKRKSASTGSRKKETESECVGKIQPSGHGDQLDLWGKEGGGGKLAPPCPTGGPEGIVGGQRNSGLYTREYTFHSQYTPYLNDT